jgi:sodium pump decarboxylase gamma subunit
MMEFLREFVMTLPAKLGYSGAIMLLGISIVFIGVVILIACIYTLSAVLSLKKGKTDKKADEAKVVVPAPVAEAAAAQGNASADELVAVITAALMAYTATESGAAATSGKKLVVRNIRAVAAQQNAWARAGRTNQLSNRF